MRFYPRKYLCSGQEKRRTKIPFEFDWFSQVQKSEERSELKAVQVDTLEQKSQWYARDRKYQSPWLEVILPKYHRSKSVFSLFLLYKRNQLQDRSNKTKRSHLSTLRTFPWTKCLCRCYSWWFSKVRLRLLDYVTRKITLTGLTDSFALSRWGIQEGLQSEFPLRQSNNCSWCLRGQPEWTVEKKKKKKQREKTEPKGNEAVRSMASYLFYWPFWPPRLLDNWTSEQVNNSLLPLAFLTTSRPHVMVTTLS